MDNTQIIKSELKGHIAAIKDVCGKNAVPFFIAVPIKNENDDTQYYTEFLTPGVCGTELKKDLISPMLNVMNGFETVPPIELAVFDF